MLLVRQTKEKQKQQKKITYFKLHYIFAELGRPCL